MTKEKEYYLKLGIETEANLWKKKFSKNYQNKQTKLAENCLKEYNEIIRDAQEHLRKESSLVSLLKDTLEAMQKKKDNTKYRKIYLQLDESLKNLNNGFTNLIKKLNQT